MDCVKIACWTAACMILLAVAGCGDESATDTGGNESIVVKEHVAKPEGHLDTAELPPDAKEVTDAEGEVFHYTVDPCNVVPAANVEEFLGRPVASEFSFVYGIPPFSRCEYAVELPEEERAGRAPDRLTVSVVESLTLSEAGFPGLTEPADAYERHKTALINAGAEIEDVRDLGDKAFIQSTDGVLHVMARGLYVRVAANIYTKETAATLDELHRKMADNNAKVAMRFAADLLLPNIQAR